MNPSSNPLVMTVGYFPFSNRMFPSAVSARSLGVATLRCLNAQPISILGCLFFYVDFTWLSAELTRQLAQTNPDQLELLDSNTTACQ